MSKLTIRVRCDVSMTLVSNFSRHMSQTDDKAIIVDAAVEPRSAEGLKL